jgi:hypothetical protein
MDALKLFRKPLTGPKWNNPGEVTFVTSPDGKYKIAFSHFFEIHMGSYHGLFNLLDGSENIIDRFEPLVTYGSQHCCWTDTSTLFAMGIASFGYGYLLMQLPEKKVAFIKAPNPFPLNIYLTEKAIILSYDDYSLSLKNSTQTFGGGPLEIPCKIYLKPTNIEIPLNSVRFFPRSELTRLGELTAKDMVYRLDPIDGGFREFQGAYPQTTMDKYNTRQLEVYQLEAFAEYGDKQSQEWLEAIIKKTKGKYSKWEKVANYLGIQRRI